MKRILLLLMTSMLLQGMPLCAMKISAKKARPRTSKNSSLVKNRISQKESASRLSLLRRIEKLTRENNELANKNFQERVYQNKLFDKSRRATFRALPNKRSYGNAFTGTLVRVKRKKRTDVFGVIAAHTLRDNFMQEGMLGKEFTAVYIHGNVAETIPAKVVHFSPSEMGDIALVKFPAKYEPLFEPIALETQELTLPAQGYSQGYACNLLSKQTFPIVGKSSTGMLTSRLPAAELGQRAGLCGSPVFTTDFQLAGIHVGSSYESNMGYITPISTLKNLIDSYYNPGIKPQLITLAGKGIGHLAMDEYVSRIEMLNARGNVVWEYNTMSKFSLSKAEAELATRTDVAAIRLTVKKAVWQEAPDKTQQINYDLALPRFILTKWTSTK